MLPTPLRLLFHLTISFTFWGLALELGADTELNIPGYRIQWNDEFEGGLVDTTRWDVNVGVNAWYQRESDGRFIEPHWFNEEFEPWLQVGAINDERQYYSPENVSVGDGLLSIRADRETVTDPVGWYNPGYHEFTSGKLNTADEFQFQYGIVKWRAQLPEGQGLWPALWMLNGPNPWFWDDEIDVMEGKGSRPNNMSSAHHFKVSDGNGGLYNQYNANEVDTGVNLQTSFHEYSLLWEPTSLTTWVDDLQVLYDTQAIPQNPMFLIMNAAVGGGFDGVPGPGVAFPTYFLIDWVRVWQEATIPSDLANGGFEDFQGPQWADWNTLDDWNISSYQNGSIHGLNSVRINRRNVVESSSQQSNLLVDGTASEWRAWLNQLDAEGSEISGAAIGLTAIPAVVDGDTASLPIYQTTPPPAANAVIYREITGSVAQGLDLTYTGTVVIVDPFPDGTSAKAFIRIFNPDYSFTDVATSVKNGGEFTLQASIPSSGVQIVQVGLETTGPTKSDGLLSASGLHLSDGTAGSGTGNRTGFNQTVTAIPGQTVHYGLLVSNDPVSPIGPGVQGVIRLEFLDASETLITEFAETIVDAASSDETLPFTFVATTPAEAAYTRISIERLTVDPEIDTAGAFMIDSVFLHIPSTTELPVFTSEPPVSQTVNAGQSLTLDIGINSPTPTIYQWYHDGQKVGTAQDYPFTADPSSGGTYFVVATNANGPVVGAVTELTVLAPDSDGDLISDYDESFVYGTDPSLKDTDRDGLTDHDEIFVAMTDPLDATSTLRINDFQLTGDQVQINFQSVSGVVYDVLGSHDLINWQPIGTSYTANGPSSTVNKTVPDSAQVTQFFRIRVSP